MPVEARQQLGAWASAVGALGATISCAPMLAATISGPLALVGVAVQSGWFADAVDRLALPVLQPVLLASLVLMAFGLGTRGRLAIAPAVIGSVLVYLGMFVLPGGAAAMLDMGMSTTEPEPSGLAAFWVGALAIAAAFVAADRRARPS